MRRVLEETVLCFGFKIIFGEEWKFVVSLIICETKMRNGIICIRRILYSLFSGLLFPTFDYFLDKKENILKRILLER